MRGCFFARGTHRRTARVFPAHAGVFLRRRHFKLSRIGLPRACGGVSETTARGSMMTTSSPRMRGCFRGTQGRSRGPLGLPRACGGVSPSTRISTTNISVFPAHAGVFPQSFAHASVRSSLPRACGGVSSRCIVGSFLTASSPRMRGCFQANAKEKDHSFVFPAHAGVFPSQCQRERSFICLPRACGGVSEFQLFLRGWLMSSPRMRGCFLTSITNQ